MKKHLILILAALTLGICMQQALATSSAAGADAFAPIWATLKAWIQGTLGKVIAGSMVLVGVISGVVRQSLMAFAVGVGGGIGLYYTPSVIENVMGASAELLSISDLFVF